MYRAIVTFDIGNFAVPTQLVDLYNVHGLCSLWNRNWIFLRNSDVMLQVVKSGVQWELCGLKSFGSSETRHCAVRLADRFNPEGEGIKIRSKRRKTLTPLYRIRSQNTWTLYEDSYKTVCRVSLSVCIRSWYHLHRKKCTDWSKSLCAPGDYSTNNSVHSNNPQTVYDLKMVIAQYIRNADRAILNTVFENRVRCVNKCLETDGWQFEHCL
jgi:hypothetical protein